MSRSVPHRVLPTILAALAATPLLTSAAGAAPSRDVDVRASIDGSTLTVDLRAAADSICDVRLGTGRRADKLPRTATDRAGRGRVAWTLPSDATTGRRAVSATCFHSGQHAAGRTYVTVPAAASADDEAMGTILNVLLYLFLGGGLLLFAGALVAMVVREPDRREKLMRGAALMVAAVVVLAADAAGVGFGEYIVESLTGEHLGGGILAVATIIPGGIGTLFGWYFVHAMRESGAMELRIMSFMGMLTVLAFLVIFGVATETEGVSLGTAALPNASFVVGLMLTVVLSLPSADGGSREGRGVVARLIELVRRRGGRGAGAIPAPAEASAPARNPFLED